MTINFLISESAADHKFNEFVSLMQDIPANEEFPDTYMYAEELGIFVIGALEKVSINSEILSQQNGRH